MQLLFFFAGALLLLALAALLTVLIAHWLRLADQLRRLLKAIALDVVQLISSASQARLDAETQRARLEYWQDVAQLRLEGQRQKLLSGEVEQ